ncbi:MAG: hypothetical protein QNK37_08550 [Acidobacteriota bacterium]|nr:hypothetical protein [Acidobacteriota bacterium]
MDRDEIRSVFENNTAAFIRVVDALTKSESLRAQFETNPVATVESMGFEFADARQATLFVRGIRAVQTFPIPGQDVLSVGVGVRAGTWPAVYVGTRPAVEALIHVGSQSPPVDEFIHEEKLYKVEKAKLNEKLRIVDLEAENKNLRAEIEKLRVRSEGIADTR